MASGMLSDKVILVTGAGRGIGREIAILAARQGAKVVVNDLGAAIDGQSSDQSPANEVVEAIRAEGGQAVANHDSVSDWEAAQRMVATAIEAFGRVDGVVNNAGILRDCIFHKMEPSDFDAVVKVHLYGSFFVSRAAAPHFRNQESGALVHMTSTSGLIGNFGQANYGAAKLGIAGLSKMIALDMARFNVRSNAIAPFAWSRLIGSIPDTPDQAERLARMKRMTPDSIAPLTVFLLADAARDVSGQVFAMRGAEVFLMGQSRPLRGLHSEGGWSPEMMAERMLPAFKGSFYKLDRTADVFSWDPVF